jgi:hypothetical protein
MGWLLIFGGAFNLGALLSLTSTVFKKIFNSAVVVVGPVDMWISVN